MINVKLNGISTTCPSCYEEMKTRHYVPFYNEVRKVDDIADIDYFKLFNILTDGDYTSFNRSVENEITFHNAISWILTQDFKFNETLPKVLVYQGRTIPIPQEPGELSIGQNIHLRRDYIDKSKALEENISIATAIYLQPFIDNKQFSIKRAIEISKDFDEMPAYLIYPIGFFLSKRALNFGQTSGRNSLLPKINPKQTLKQMWRVWRKFIS